MQFFFSQMKSCLIMGCFYLILHVLTNIDTPKLPMIDDISRVIQRFVSVDVHNFTSYLQFDLIVLQLTSLPAILLSPVFPVC